MKKVKSTCVPADNDTDPFLPGHLVVAKNGMVVLTTNRSVSTRFEGVIVFAGDHVNYSCGDLDLFYRQDFNPFHGTITLEQ